MDAAAVVEPKPTTLMEGVVEPKAQPVPSAVKEDTIVNRETKLALLIGFVAIVVVTVLVGEHFGKARNTAPATTDLGTSTAAAPSTTGLTVDPITATPVATPSMPVPTPAPLGTGTAGTVQPIELTTTGTPANGPALSGQAPAVPVANGNPNVFLPPAAAGVDTLGTHPTTPSTLGGPEVPGTRPVGTIGVDNPVPTPPPGFQAPLTGKPVSAGVEKMHPVQRGETLSAIAQRYYGDKSLAKQLTSYNAKRLSANGTIREGVTVRIPPRDVLIGAAVLDTNAAGRTDSPSTLKPEAPRTAAKPKASDKPVTTAEKPKTGPRTYTIKKGDTLMTIASKELGSAKRWESLLIANPSLDENSLRAGMTIKIPAK